MERLTEKRNGINVIPLRRDGSPEWCVSENQNDGTISVFGAAADKLAAYEDTGLDPAEVAAMIQNCDKSVYTMKTEIYEKAKAYDRVAAENVKLRELLKLAVEDMEGVTKNVAFEGLVCGSECVHFWECERVKSNDDRMYRCQEFKWRHAGEVEEVLTDE